MSEGFIWLTHKNSHLFCLNESILLNKSMWMIQLTHSWSHLFHSWINQCCWTNWVNYSRLHHKDNHLSNSEWISGVEQIKRMNDSNVSLINTITCFFPEWFSSSEQINRVNNLNDSLMNSHLFHSCCWINRLSEWLKILIHKADHLFHSWMNQCCWTIDLVKDSNDSKTVTCFVPESVCTEQINLVNDSNDLKETLVQFLDQSMLLNKLLSEWFKRQSRSFYNWISVAEWIDWVNDSLKKTITCSVQ